MSELIALKAFSIHEFTFASTLQFFSTREPRNAKVFTTRPSPCPGWSVRGIAGSVCLDGRTANTLVFTVLAVRPIEEQVDSNDLNICSRSLLESARSTMSLAYAMVLKRSLLVNFFCPHTSFCSPMWYSRGRPFCWWFYNNVKEDVE